MLLDPAHASKALCHDPGCIMVAIARKVGALHLRVRDGFPNHVLDFLSGHRHDDYPCYDCARSDMNWQRASTALASSAVRTSDSSASTPAEVSSIARASGSERVSQYV